MATTKAFELAQLSALADVTTSDTTLSDELVLDGGSLTLDGGRNVQWGGAFGSGFPSVWGHSANKQIRFAPDGNTSGMLYQMSATQLDINPTTTSTTSTSGALVVAGGAGIAENLNVGGNAGVTGNLTVTGDLTVEGSQVTLNTTALDVEDKNITLNYHASNDTSASASGAGITIQDAVDASTDATILWDASDDQFDFSHGVNVSGNSNISGNLDLAGSTTEVRSLQIGHGRTGDGISLIDLVGDTTYSDYGFRVQRAGGANGKSSLLHHGTGNLEIRALEAATIRFKTTDSDRMHIKSGGDIHFYDSAGNVEMAWDASAGSLGIGTDEPKAILDARVAQDTLTNVLANEIYAASFLSTDSGNTGHTTAIMLSGSSGTNRGVAIAAEAQSTGNDHDMIFATSASGSTPAEHVRITSVGKVGIGTDDPSSELHISGTGSKRLKIEKTDSGGDADLQISSANDSTQWILFHDRNSGNNSGVIKYVHSTNKMHFRTNDGDDRLVIADDGNVGIGTDSPDAGLHINGTSPHMDVGPHGGNRAKFGYHNLDVIIGSTSSTGEIIFKNNMGSTDSPQVGGDDKVTIHDVGMTIHSDTYNILDVQTDSNNDQTSTDGIIKISNYNGTSHLTKAEFRWDESEDLVHVSYGDHGRHISINSSGNVGIGTHSVSPAHTLDVDGAIATRQVRHNISPTLNLDFAKSKELDPRISFYRNSIATYYDSKGILRYATHNEPRFDHNPVTGESRGLLIEEDRQGLNTNTITVNGGYWGFSNATASIKQAVAPDGTFSADAIHANTVNDGHGLFKAFTPSASTYYTLTGYYKRGANRYVSQAWYYNEAAGSSNFPTAYYDLDNGTFTHTSGINRGTTMTDVGNGWYRCSLTVLTDSTPSTSYFYATSSPTSGTAAYVGTGAADTYYWGLQIEIGPNPTSFMPSDTRFSSRSSKGSYHDENGVLRFAGVNEPRYGYMYDGRKWVETGLIHEAQSENLIIHSEDLEQWSVTRTTLTPNTNGTTAPDGSKNANKLEETTATGEHAIIQHRPVPSTGLVTLSIYAKAAERSVFGIQMYNSGGTIAGNGSTSPLTYFNLSTGTVSDANTGINPTITPAGNGWYRITMSGICNSAGTTASCWMYTSNSTSYTAHAGTAGSGVYLWGGQLEMGHASSYIRTVGSAVTRSADVAKALDYTRDTDYAYIDLEKHNFWNDEESTIYAESETYIEDYTLYNYNASIFGFGPDSGRVQVRYDDQSGIHGIGYTNISGSFASLFDLSPSTQTFVQNAKVALSMKQDDYDFSVNGSPAVSDSAGIFPSPNRLFFGTYRELATPSNSEHLNGAIRKFSYYDTKLTNAELEALTENN